MDHPVFGTLRPRREGGWVAWLSLPAFQSCYERWDADGTERPDTRGEAEKSGRFPVHINPVLVDGPGQHSALEAWMELRRRFSAAPAGGPGRQGEAPPPSDAQTAAAEYLLKHQDAVARAIGVALVREAPRVYDLDYLQGTLSDEMKRRLAEPEGMMQAVELESLVVGVRDEGGCARIGFAFHSELLEPEHAVGVVTLRDRVLVVGTFDDLMDLAYPGGDGGDEEADE